MRRKEKTIGNRWSNTSQNNKPDHGTGSSGKSDKTDSENAVLCRSFLSELRVLRGSAFGCF